MRRAHSSRSCVRFSRRCATSSRSSAALVSGAAPSPAGGKSDVSHPFSSVARGAPGACQARRHRALGAQRQDRDVVARLPGGGGQHGLLDALGDRVGGQPDARAQHLDQLAVPEHLAPAPADLGDAVGVEHDHVAGRELDGHVGQLRLDVRAQQRAEPPDRLDAAVARTTNGSGCPPQASVSRAPLRRDVQVAVGDGAEAPVGALLAQRAVQQREHRRAAARRPPRAQRVARQRGHRRGLGALALHVADQHRVGAVARREQVVEVAADLDALAGRPEAHRRADRPGHRRQRRRQQAALEHLGDVALAA